MGAYAAGADLGAAGDGGQYFTRGQSALRGLLLGGGCCLYLLSRLFGNCLFRGGLCVAVSADEAVADGQCTDGGELRGCEVVRFCNLRGRLNSRQFALACNQLRYMIVYFYS